MLETEIKRNTEAVLELTTAIRAMMDDLQDVGTKPAEVAGEDQGKTQVKKEAEKPAATAPEPTSDLPAITHQECIAEMGQIAQKMGDASKLAALIPQFGGPDAKKISDVPVEQLAAMLEAAKLLVA